MARIRKAAGMIQLDLAKAVEINRVTVSDIERGKQWLAWLSVACSVCSR